MDTPKHSDFRGDRCGAQARRRVSVFKGSFLCLEKNCWPGPTGLLSLPHRTPQHPRIFEGEEMIFKPSNMLLASFFASNFLDENNSRQQREFVSVRVFLPLKKRESFRIMYVQQHFFVIYLGCLGRQQTQNPKRFKFNSETASVGTARHAAAHPLARGQTPGLER